MKTFLILDLRFLIAGRAAPERNGHKRTQRTQRTRKQDGPATQSTDFTEANKANEGGGVGPKAGSASGCGAMHRAQAGRNCRVCPARPGLSRLVPRCPTCDFFWGKFVARRARRARRETGQCQGRVFPHWQYAVPVLKGSAESGGCPTIKHDSGG